MTIDLRPVNAATIPVSWPMPQMQAETSDFAGSKAFAVIDYCSGYWQFPLDAESQDCQSIVTPNGVFSPTRTLQGAVNSASNFQGKVEPLYAELRPNLKAWLDGFILHARSFAELLRILRTYFGITRAHNLFLSAIKTTLYARKAKWCGRIIDAEGVRLDPSQYDVLTNLSEPRAGGELSQFVHAVTWLHSSIPDFARRMAPLRDLLEKVYKHGRSRANNKIGNIPLAAELSWGPDHATAFSDLQTQLRNAVTLAHFDPKKVLCLHTDASSSHWGGVLTQLSETDVRVPAAEQRHAPLAFFGGAFTQREAAWSTFEQEGYAIVAIFKKVPFTIESAARVLLFTDHRNLLFAYSPLALKPDVGRHVITKVQRWAQYLSRFCYEVYHVSGEENYFADLLTRWAVGFRGHGTPNEPPARIKRSGKVSLLLNKTECLDLQSPWPTAADIIEAQEQGRDQTDGSPAELEDGLSRSDGVWRTRDGQVWIPRAADTLKVRLLVIAHCGNAGHRGRKATSTMLKAHFWWVGLEDDVREFCAQCLLCLCVHGGSRVPRPLGAAIHGRQPGEVIHFDYLYLFPAEDGKKYVMVVRDDLSSYTWLAPAESPTATHAAQTLARWFSTFRIPEVCVSDGASHFRNKIMATLADKHRVRHHVTTAYTPWANGTAERVGREVLRALRVLDADLKVKPDRWPELVLATQAILNNSPLERIGGWSPTEVFTGQRPTT